MKLSKQGASEICNKITEQINNLRTISGNSPCTEFEYIERGLNTLRSDIAESVKPAVSNKAIEIITHLITVNNAAVVARKFNTSHQEVYRIVKPALSRMINYAELLGKNDNFLKLKENISVKGICENLDETKALLELWSTKKIPLSSLHTLQ